MEKKQLQGSLQELHTTLQQTQQVDGETRDLLQNLATDIQRMLDQDEAPKQDEVHSLSSDLKDLLLKFESEHPQLTGVLGKIADSLANLGI